MPTIPQLPLTNFYTPGDEFPLSQSGVTRSIQMSTLLSTVQPLIQLSGGTLLGRASAGDGNIELIIAGTGLAMGAGTLVANGVDHGGFAEQGIFDSTTEVILNAAGTPRRMAVLLLRGLFSAGANVAIDGNGVISATVPAFHAGTGAPPAGLGADGDSWLDVASGEVWTHQSGSWVDTGQNLLAGEVAAREAVTLPLVRLQASTNGAVGAVLTPDGTANTQAPALLLANQRGLLRISGCVVAQDVASGESCIWDVAAAVKRPASGQVPTLVGTPAVSVFAVDSSMSGCALALDAVTSGLQVSASGIAGRTLDWSATILAVIGT